MNTYLNPASRSLEHKLRLLAEGEALELTAAEAAVYGADDADELPEEEDREENHD